MQHQNPGRKRIRVVGLALFLAALSTPFWSAAGEFEEIAPVTGESLYRIYCATCHGKSAKGDGPTATYLTVKPVDLTRLSRRNGGEFPTEKTREIIDGREVVRGHGEREMPLWGLAFQDWAVDRSQEAEVRTRIDQLVRYLESIQKK
jgi:mono/diheme cytochrome c family protein